MAGDISSLNPWARADLERFNSDTLALIPEGLREEYTRIMKELAHARGIAALVLEQMFQKEEERRTFFEYLINTKTPDNAGVSGLAAGNTLNSPDNNTKAPEGADVLYPDRSPDYTPDETGYPPNVIDFAKYLAERP